MVKPGMQRVLAARIRKIHGFLQSESTFVLSVTDTDGSVHSSPLLYLVAENLDLIWLSSVDSRHSRCLVFEPRTSVAVFRSTFEWRKIVGVQMEGQSAEVAGPERASLVQAYCARFELGMIPSLVVAGSTLYRFRPQWIRYIDNDKHFGYKFELSL